jgi:hypothetical protein
MPTFDGTKLFTPVWLHVVGYTAGQLPHLHVVPGGLLDHTKPNETVVASRMLVLRVSDRVCCALPEGGG